MCHHPKRFSEDCVNFNMHEEIKELEESAPNDLNKAAEKYSFPFRGGRDIWKSDITNAFKAGAKWQKEQMMKAAVEGYVNYYEDSGGILMAEAQVGCPYHNGDKVRLIVLPMEE